MFRFLALHNCWNPNIEFLEERAVVFEAIRNEKLKKLRWTSGIHAIT